MPARHTVGVYWREYSTALGREGLRALSTYILCAVVLLLGISVVLFTWASTKALRLELSAVPLNLTAGALIVLVFFGTRLFLRTPTRVVVIGLLVFVLLLLAVTTAARHESVEITLPAFWLLLAGLIGIAGFLLSDQVGKPWVRGLVLIGLVILGLLLLTIGRNEQVNAASASAKNAYLQLSELEMNEQRRPLQDVLLNELALVGGTVRGEVACPDDQDQTTESDDQCVDVENVAESANDAALGSSPLLCPSGWTLGALEEWMNDASLDRKVAALTAVARCELGAFDPGAVESETNTPEVVVTETPDDVEEAAALVDAESSAQAAIDARVAVNEAVSIQRTRSNLIETLDSGADGVLSSISGPNEFAEFRFSGITWLIFLGILLLWYRQLEIRAGGHGLGPVEIRFDEATPDDGKTSSGNSSTPAAPLDDRARSAGQAIFKQAVVQNVPEPGAVPGAQALAPVGDLVSSSDVPNKWVASGIVDAIRTILATRGGYTVVYSAHGEGDLAHGQSGRTSAVVFVRIRDRRNDAQKASMRFEADYIGEAAELAGYWVAGWIISRSRYVPEWAKWSERDAQAFYKLQWRQGDDLPLRAHGIVDPSGIETSVNSLVLTQRAYAYEMEPSMDHPATFNALEDFARAAYHQPRYPVARFRRAVALSVLAQRDVQIGDVFVSSSANPMPSRTRMLHLFDDLLGLEEPADSDDEPRLPDQVDEALVTGTFDEEMRHSMLERVQEMTDSARVGIRAGLLARLRPSEGPFWRDFRRTVDDWVALVDVSKAIAQLRLYGPLDQGRSGHRLLVEEIEKRANHPSSHWQVSYNIACYYSLRSAMWGEEPPRTSSNSHLDRSPSPSTCSQLAFSWLQRCLDRPNSGQLVREWAMRDPDLAQVRRYSDEWTRWIRRVPRLPVQIRLGDKSSMVKKLQEQLNAARRGCRRDEWPEMFDEGAPEWPILVEDGSFGDTTARAIGCMQYVNDLRVTGTPDLQLLSLLESQPSITTKHERGDGRPSPGDRGPADRPLKPRWWRTLRPFQRSEPGRATRSKALGGRPAGHG